MDILLNILNVLLVIGIVFVILYFIDKKIINKKYYSAYKKAYNYALMTLNDADKERILKNLKDYQEEVLTNSQYLLLDNTTFSKNELNNKKIELNEKIQKLENDKKIIQNHISELHNSVSSKDIEETFERLKLELSEEIENINKQILKKESDAEDLRNKSIQAAKIKNTNFSAGSMDTYSSKLMLELQTIANLIPFYVITYIEYLISIEFFSQLFEKDTTLGQIIPFVLTTMLLIFVDLSVKYSKENKEYKSLVLIGISIITIFLISYSRIYPRLDGDPITLIIEALKLLVFTGVVALNYFLMDRYEINTEDLILAPFRALKVLIEIVSSYTLNIFTKTINLTSKAVDPERISNKLDVRKKNNEIDDLKIELNKKLAIRNGLMTKKDEQILNRKNSLTTEYNKRLEEINQNIINSKNEISGLQKNLGKNVEIDSQVKNGSYDGTNAAIKKFFKLR
jgi:hypothetical protein